MCHGKICSTASATGAEGNHAADANYLIQTTTNEPYSVKKVITLKGLRRHSPMYNVSCILYVLQ